MNCKKVFSRLNAYADGELPATLMREISEHLDTCLACRSHAERIHRVGDILDSLSVPPLPGEFAACVMAEAKRKNPPAAKKRHLLLIERQALPWLFDLSVPMRLTACALVLLACLLGMYMSKELSLSNSQYFATEAANLDGFEWFSLTPPSSLGCAYLTLASGSSEDQGAR